MKTKLDRLEGYVRLERRAYEYAMTIHYIPDEVVPGGDETAWADLAEWQRKRLQ